MPPFNRVPVQPRPKVIYNEIEPFAVDWLRNLSRQNLIAPGTVDASSISDLDPARLRDAVQFHTFAGIGAWSYALRLAGWPDDRPVWTGSCPCQPFSVAGEGRGVEDERHLWPDFFRLIRECRPPVLFGEQVASAAGRAWLAAVRADLESVGYAVGAADLCAAGVGAPHIRQRLFFGAVRLADAERDGRGQVSAHAGGRGDGGGAEGLVERSLRGGVVDDPEGGLADDMLHGLQGREPALAAGGGRRPSDAGGARGRGLGHPFGARLEGLGGHGDHGGQPGRERAVAAGSASPAGGARLDPWADPEWVRCRDNKFRPVEPGTFPLAHGAPARVGRLRGYGNCIVPQVAATFVRAFMDVIDGVGE